MRGASRPPVRILRSVVAVRPAETLGADGPWRLYPRAGRMGNQPESPAGHDAGRRAGARGIDRLPGSAGPGGSRSGIRRDAHARRAARGRRGSGADPGRRSWPAPTPTPSRSRSVRGAGAAPAARRPRRACASWSAPSGHPRRAGFLPRAPSPDASWPWPRWGDAACCARCRRTWRTRASRDSEASGGGLGHRRAVAHQGRAPHVARLVGRERPRAVHGLPVVPHDEVAHRPPVRRRRTGAGWRARPDRAETPAPPAPASPRSSPRARTGRATCAP